MTDRVVVSDIFGGGVVGAGGNGLQGYVQSANPILGGGGLTIGSASFLSGVAPTDFIGDGVTTYAVHEFGHTLQFFGLSAVGGALNSQGAVWGSYIGLGVLGGAAPNGVGAWWENMASAL